MTLKIHLADKKCVACEGGVSPLNVAEVSSYLKQVQGWAVSKDYKVISKDFKFTNFKTAMDFANKVGDLAEAEGHHPDMQVSWGKVGISLTTHAISGLSENDFIFAAKVDIITTP